MLNGGRFLMEMHVSMKPMAEPNGFALAANDPDAARISPERFMYFALGKFRFCSLARANSQGLPTYVTSRHLTIYGEPSQSSDANHA